MGRDQRACGVTAALETLHNATAVWRCYQTQRDIISYDPQVHVIFVIPTKLNVIVLVSGKWENQEKEDGYT